MTQQQTNPDPGLVNADEVVFTITEARRAVRAAQDGLADMQHGLTRAVRSLSDVEWGQRRMALGEGWPDRGGVEDNVRDLAHRCEDATTAGREVEQQVTQARAALQAARVLIEGMQPTTKQGHVDQDGLRSLTLRLDTELRETQPALNEAVNGVARAGLIAREAAPGHGIPTTATLPTETWQQMLSGASRGNTNIQESLDRVWTGTTQVAGYADGIAAAARTRTEQRATPPTQHQHQPGIPR